MSDTFNDTQVSDRKMRQRESLRNRDNGIEMNQNGNEEKTSPDKDHSEQRSKLRKRELIAKPETLQYEPNLNKGFHAKIMQSILTESSKSKQKEVTNSSKTGSKRKSESPKKDKQNGVKKNKSESSKPIEVFDSYAFSMQLINTEDEKIQAQKGKDFNEKYVLMIGNLLPDVTREQLEEHFRKTGGIKSIRIPRDRGSDKGQGFAYMEFDGRISLGIALRLHQTTLGGRQINVEFSSPGGGKSQKVRQK